jgi:hypothetical protein
LPSDSHSHPSLARLVLASSVSLEQNTHTTRERTRVFCGVVCFREHALMLPKAITHFTSTPCARFIRFMSFIRANPLTLQRRGSERESARMLWFCFREHALMLPKAITLFTSTPASSVSCRSSELPRNPQRRGSERESARVLWFAFGSMRSCSQKRLRPSRALPEPASSYPHPWP